MKLFLTRMNVSSLVEVFFGIEQNYFKGLFLFNLY